MKGVHLFIIQINWVNIFFKKFKTTVYNNDIRVSLAVDSTHLGTTPCRYLRRKIKAVCWSGSNFHWEPEPNFRQAKPRAVKQAYN